MNEYERYQSRMINQLEHDIKSLQAKYDAAMIERGRMKAEIKLLKDKLHQLTRGNQC